MKENIKIKGKIVSGSKKASYFTQLDWVRNQCITKLGFSPYPGTFNLEIEGDNLKILDKFKKTTTMELTPDNKDFCSAKILPVEVSSIKSIKAAIIIPEEEVNIHKKNIIEIIAPVSLRKNLNLEDGDIVEVFLPCSFTE